MGRFTLNGKVVYTKELDFAYLVELDKRGIEVSNVAGVAALNCFVAFCTGMSEKQASDEISLHIINGGKLTDITDVYVKELEESGFFRALIQQTAERQEEVEEKSEKTTKRSVKKNAEASD